MQNRLCLLLFLCAAVLARGEWISTAETGSYNDPANWRNGLCDDTFSGPEAPLTRTVLSVEADRLVGPDGLRIRHDAAAALVLEGVGGPRTFNFPEGGAILVDIGGASDAVAVRTGVQNSETARIDFDFGANPAIVSLSPDATSGRDTLSCFGSIRGRSFRREGDGTLKLYGAIETANGEAAFLGGTTYLYNWGVSGTHGLPGLTTLRLESGAKLSLQSAVNPQTVTLSGGFLQSDVALTADTLELLPGRAVLIARDNADFSFGAIRRTEASFLTLGANEAARIGAGSLIRLSGENATNLLAECVGGGVPYSETPDSSRISIVPWAGASSFSTQESFETSTEAHDPALPVAFDAALGFVTLPESSLLDGLSTATPEDNVLISEAAVTLETDAAANCLVLKTWGTTLDLNTNTLTLASGLLLHRNTKPTLRNGTLALGTEPLRAFGRQNLTISSTVTSPNTDPDATIILTASAGGGGEKNSLHVDVGGGSTEVVDGVEYPTYRVDGEPIGGYVFRKFLRNYGGAKRDEGDMYWPVIRLADVFLMYAEADNEVNGPQPKAIELVNRIRYRAGLPALAGDKTASRDAFFAAIEQERAVELVGEGQRSFDLRRWRTIEKAFGVTGPGYAGYYCTDTYGGRKQQWYVNPTARDIQRAYIFAIPQSERDRNPNMSQNTPWL